MKPELHGLVAAAVRRTAGLALIGWGIWQLLGAPAAAVVTGCILLIPVRRGRR